MSAVVERRPCVVLEDQDICVSGMAYLNLLKACLLNLIYGKKTEPGFDLAARLAGVEWPSVAHTMVGLARLNNFEYCIRQAMVDGVPGDVIEAGVWRGGASILARAVLRAVGDEERSVWVADSFCGLPRSERDPDDKHHEKAELAVPLDEVRENFCSYGLLDDRVKFLPGWFKDTLRAAPIGRLCVARLDGDIYESTRDALEALYPRLSPGGFVIIDDYCAVSGCRAATNEFREKNGITEGLQRIDQCGVFWRRAAR